MPAGDQTPVAERARTVAVVLPRLVVRRVVLGLGHFRNLLAAATRRVSSREAWQAARAAPPRASERARRGGAAGRHSRAGAAPLAACERDPLPPLHRRVENFEKADFLSLFFLPPSPVSLERRVTGALCKAPALHAWCFLERRRAAAWFGTGPKNRDGACSRLERLLGGPRRDHR